MTLTQPWYDTAGPSYRSIMRATARAATAAVTGSGDYVVSENGNVSAPATAGVAPILVYLDAADPEFAFAGSTPKLRLSAAASVADVAPACTLIVGLYPLGTPSGGTTVWNPNLGAVIAASRVTFTTPAANSKSTNSQTAQFSFPTAGWYAIGVNASAAMAANSTVMIPFSLSVANV